jgi:class 3 adenylate cyclase
VNVAARVGAESKGGDVVILKEVFNEVSRLFEDARVEPFNTRLRGLEGERELVRILLAGKADPPSLRSPQRGEKA